MTGKSPWLNVPICPDGFEFGLSAEKYISISGTSQATATRDLQVMVDKGVFTRSVNLNLRGII